MITLKRPALNPGSVRDPIQTLLATRAQIQMILKQRAQKLPPDRRKLSLHLPMLKTGRVLAPQPTNDLLKPLTRATERILLAAVRREILCSTLSPTLSLQDFISRRVKFAATGAGVGDHVAHLPGSTLL